MSSVTVRPTAWLLAGVVLTFVSPVVGSAEPARKDRPPNVVIIFTDDKD